MGLKLDTDANVIFLFRHYLRVHRKLKRAAEENLETIRANIHEKELKLVVDDDGYYFEIEDNLKMTNHDNRQDRN